MVLHPATRDLYIADKINSAVRKAGIPISYPYNGMYEIILGEELFRTFGNQNNVRTFFNWKRGEVSLLSPEGSHKRSFRILGGGR